MNRKHHQYYQRIQELVLVHLTPVLVRRLENQVQLIKEAQSSLSDYYSHTELEDDKVEILEMLRKMRSLKESLARSINGVSDSSQKPDLDEEFSDYFGELKSYADTLPELLLEDQSLDRFVPFPNDSFRIKVGKRLKKLGLLLGWMPRRIANWARSKSNKKIVPLKLWKHEIPLRGLIIYHFRDLLVEQIIDMEQAINRTIATSTNELYEMETSLDKKFAIMIGQEDQEGNSMRSLDQDTKIDQILSKINDLAESISGVTANRMERIFNIFQLNYDIVGTIELSVKNFSTSGLEETHRQAARAYRKTMEGWNNTLNVLSDRYSFDNELFNTRFTNLEQYLYISQKLETVLSEKILRKINEVSEFLSARKRQLESSSIDDADFKKSLKEVKYEISKFLKRSIPDCVQLIAEQNIPVLLENFELKTKNQVAQLSETRSIVKNLSYEHAIKESDISRIAPKDLITFEALPAYLKKLQNLRAEVTEVIEETQQNLMEISNICDFNLETALAALDDRSQHDRAKTMSIEGIERACSRIQDIISDLTKIATSVDNTIHTGADEFNERIMALNEIDQAFDTQVRLAKAMALEKTREFRKRILDQFKQGVPRMITNLKRRGLMLYKRYREASQKYGIANPTQTLSAEISGFLSDTEYTVNNLPFVYQRLFEISPLENPYFLVPRPLVTYQLKKAYENWEAGHYGATALIAESGSGVTTLIRFFLQEYKIGIPVLYAESSQQIYQEKDLFLFFEKTLQIEGLTDLETLVEYFNKQEGKRMFILEDLEHFFLRKVNGFDCITIILELITRTNQKVLWLTSINQFSFDYLDKTLNINDYFAFNIVVKPFKPHEITSLILKRHRVSGFSVRFLPDKMDRKNSKFRKMNDEERQEYLQSEFFTSLNRIVQSNISLALIYWLRAIKEIDDDVMYIRSLKSVDFSFLSKLSDEKQFTLHAMLLHDGITVRDHAKVFMQSVKRSELTLLALTDDGIIVLENGRFHINPLLFRQAVNLLSAKNIIH